MAGDAHDALDPPLGLGAARLSELNREDVMGGEGDRPGVKRRPLAAADMAADDGLRAVVQDAPGHPAEELERQDVAGSERGEILGGGVATERVTGVGKDHVEAVDVKLSFGCVDRSLVSPVDPRLSSLPWPKVESVQPE